MTSPILNIADVDMIDLAERSRQRGSEMPTARFGGRIGPIGPHIGAQKLGYNLTAVAPGKAAFPKHSHRVNEEMFYILDGAGELSSAIRPIRSAPAMSSPAHRAGRTPRINSSTPAATNCAFSP